MWLRGTRSHIHFPLLASTGGSSLSLGKNAHFLSSTLEHTNRTQSRPLPTTSVYNPDYVEEAPLTDKRPLSLLADSLTYRRTGSRVANSVPLACSMDTVCSSILSLFEDRRFTGHCGWSHGHTMAMKCYATQSPSKPLAYRKGTGCWHR